MPESPAERPAALLVTRNFPPLLGGMERLNRHLLEELAPDWRPLLSGPAGSAAHVRPGIEAAETAIKPLPRFLVLCLLRALRLAIRHRPARVIAGSGLTAPIALLVGRLVGAPVIAYLHGLDIIAPSRVYQACWLPFIRRCDVLLVNSANTGALARAAGVPGGRIRVLHPGTELPAWPTQAPPPGAPMLISVGRLTRRKGLTAFVAEALPRIRARVPDAVLTIIGDEARDALHGAGGSERARIQAAADAAGVGDAVRFLGHCSEDALHAALFAATVHVFPVLEEPGDVEGFGMVAIEAAAHGVQTVAFAVGGVPDAISVPDSGRLVAAGDYPGFAAAVVEAIARAGQPDTRDACRRFAATLGWERFGAGLRDALREPDHAAR